MTYAPKYRNQVIERRDRMARNCPNWIGRFERARRNREFSRARQDADIALNAWFHEGRWIEFTMFGYQEREA